MSSGGMDRIRRGIWLPCSGSDLTQGRVTTLWRVSGSGKQQGMQINHVLDFLLDFYPLIQGKLDIPDKNIQEDLDPTFAIVVSASVVDGNNG